MPWIISAQMVFSSQLFSWDFPRVLLDSTIIWLTIKLGISLTDWSNRAKVKETSQIVSTWPFGQNVVKLALFNPSWEVEVEVEEQNEQCGTLSISSPAIVHSGYCFFLPWCFVSLLHCCCLVWLHLYAAHMGHLPALTRREGSFKRCCRDFKSARRTHRSLTF